eukprot:COSAG01_NODE_294_length_19294_cov_35.559312_1_plen_114_part_10
MVQRGDSVSSTMLRKVATSERSAKVWVDSRTSVGNGETVTVMRREGDFTWIRTTAGIEGYVKAAYLLHAQALESAVVQRGDGVSSTMLRKVATSERSAKVWVDSRTSVGNGETV